MVGYLPFTQKMLEFNSPREEIYRRNMRRIAVSREYNGSRVEFRNLFNSGECCFFEAYLKTGTFKYRLSRVPTSIDVLKTRENCFACVYNMAGTGLRRDMAKEGVMIGSRYYSPRQVRNLICAICL